MSNENRKRKIYSFTLNQETEENLRFLSSIYQKSKSNIIDMLVDEKIKGEEMIEAKRLFNQQRAKI